MRYYGGVIKMRLVTLRRKKASKKALPFVWYRRPRHTVLFGIGKVQAITSDARRRFVCFAAKVSRVKD